MLKISVATVPEAEEAAAELLEAIFGRPASSYTDAKSRRTQVAAYLSKTPEKLDQKQKELRAGIARMRAGGLRVGSGRISVTRVARENWAWSWRHHFRPLEIGAKLLIKPSWSRRRGRQGQAVVVLDPGLSFGTGQHPTTAFCLRQLAARRKPEAAQSFLDLGTGSGILAIAAARLGYKPVLALDVDQDALRIARSNARSNHVQSKIRLSGRDVAQLRQRRDGQYSVVCANLDAALLVAHRDRILACMRGDGVLVMAGILADEFELVRRLYEDAGLRLVGSRSEKGWRSAVFDWE